MAEWYFVLKKGMFKSLNYRCLRHLFEHILQLMVAGSKSGYKQIWCFVQTVS